MSGSFLYPDENELLLRAALFSGENLASVSVSVKSRCSDSFSRAISDAIGQSEPIIRLNALKAIAATGSCEDAFHCVALLINDSLSEIREIAADTILAVNKPECYEAVMSFVSDPSSRRKGLNAIAHLRAASDSRTDSSKFETYFSRMTYVSKGSVWLLSRYQRTVAWLSVLPYIYFPAAILSAFGAAFYRTIPASLNMGGIQTSPSAGMGFFHGIVAGFAWAGSVVAGVSFYTLVLGKERNRDSLGHLAGSCACACVANTLATFVLFLFVASVYEIKSIEAIAWISTKDPPILRYSNEFWASLFWGRRLSHTFFVEGIGIAVGMASSMHLVRCSESWNRFLGRQSIVTSLAELPLTIWRILRVFLRFSWPIVVSMCVAGFVSYYVPICDGDGSWWTLPLPKGEKSTSWGVLTSIIGDCSSQAIGSFCGVVGGGVGVIMVRHGISVKPQRGGA